MDRIALIKDDVLAIARRLKSYDRGYYVVYNITRSRFEVHNSRSRDSLAIVIPYPSLDERTIRLVLKTRIERMDAIIKEIDESNARLEDARNRNIINETGYKANEIIKSLSRGLSIVT